MVSSRARLFRSSGWGRGGCSIASDEDVRFYLKLARQEGGLLDPTYTGKAFDGMLAKLRKTPDRFGKTVRFLDSGGTFATFACQEQFARLLAAQRGSNGSRCHPGSSRVRDLRARLRLPGL